MKAYASQLLRILAVGLCSAIGAAVIVFVYLQGIDLGKQVGRGEFACGMTNGKFVALDDDDYVQCESNGPIKWVYSVEMKPPHK